MNTIDIIAQAIAETYGFSSTSSDYVVEVLSGKHEGEEYFEELDRLAADAATSTEVLEAIDSYCSENLNEEFAIDADDVHLTIRAIARENLAKR